MSSPPSKSPPKQILANATGLSFRGGAAKEAGGGGVMHLPTFLKFYCFYCIDPTLSNALTRPPPHLQIRGAAPSHICLFFVRQLSRVDGKWGGAVQ